MKSDVAGPRHRELQISGFKGLFSNTEDPRNLQPGYAMGAQDVIFDAEGSCRPRDGSSVWWPAISQRVYLAEFLPTESWTGGTEDYVDFEFGYSSRYLESAGTNTMVADFGSAIDTTLNGVEPSAASTFNIWIKAATPADVTAASLTLTSSDGNYLTANIVAAVNALAAAEWTLVQVPFADFVATGTPVPSSITSFTISITSTAGDKIGFDEAYVSYSNYGNSFGVGMLEFTRVADGARFLLAQFGDTVFADLNEAQAPYKILSQLTRNRPLQIDVGYNRAVMTNGVDPGYVFTGDTVRPIGFPAPAGTWAPGYTYTGVDSPFNIGDVYFYGVAFVYGDDGEEYGQSNMLVSETGTNVTATGDNINLANIPVAPPGSGVVARRVYRCIEGAGALATMYLLTEIADNTTTTYEDSASDAEVVTAETGAIDNGIPPIARQAVWFQKGMVYITANTVQWSRVGVDINSDIEIVPGENVLVYGQFGELVGAVEFNSTLYVFGKKGITSVYWQGAALYDQPVERASENRAQNVGCYDARSVTVVQNRYMRWQDCYGQVWRMWPNGQIDPESRHVANLLNDFNRLPIAGSDEIANFVGEDSWNGGTVGANLTTTETVGLLQYRDTTARRGVQLAPGGTATLLPPFTDAFSFARGSGPTDTVDPNCNTSAPVENSDTNMSWQAINATMYLALSVGGGAGSQQAPGRLPGQNTGVVALSALAFYGTRQDNNGNPPGLSWKLYAPNYEVPGVLGAELDSGNCAVAFDVPPGLANGSAWSATATLTDTLYIPNNEFVILAVQLVSWDPAGGGVNPFVDWPFLAYTPYTFVGLGASDLYASVVLPQATLTYDPYETSTGGLISTRQAYYLQASGTVYYSGSSNLNGNGYAIPPNLQQSNPQGTDQLQRWWKVSTGNSADDNLRSASAITVTAQGNADNVNYSGIFQVYSKTATVQSDTIEPISTTVYTLFPVSDWRYGGSNPPIEYHVCILTVNFQFPENLVQNLRPASQGVSRISITQTDAIPQLTDPEMSYSWETAIPNPYDPTKYTNDIWVSEATLLPNGVTTFGKFSVQFSQQQEALTFQIRTATTEATLADAVWTTIQPNADLTQTYTPVPGATYFQLQVIFQDINGLFLGIPSSVTSMSIAWQSAETQLEPIVPPMMYYYRDYTYMCWTSKSARLPDRMFAIDDTGDTDISQYTAAGQLTNRWSSFTTIYSTCMAQSNLDLVACPPSGGIVMKLRLSSPTDIAGNLVVGYLTLHPLTGGTPYLKTFYWFYLETRLNCYVDGFFVEAEWENFVTDGPSPYILYAISGDGSPLYGQSSVQTGLLFPTNEQTSMVVLNSNYSELTPDFGSDILMQERAACLNFVLVGGVDGQGNSWLPLLVGTALEWYTENYRGV